MNTFQLPLTRDLSQSYVLSFAVAFLAAIASLAGLLFQFNLYPTEELRLAFVPNDVVNLFIGLPALLASMWFTRRGSLPGLLFWPGALLYITYNYIASSVAMPFTLQFVLYLALVVLSGFSTFQLVSGMDATRVQQQLAGAVPEKFAGGVLLAFGVLFFLMRAVVVVRALSGQGSPDDPLAVAVADLFTMPFWIMGGILLWRKKGLGYVSGGGLLFQASMLFVGLLIVFILRPFLTAATFPLEDFIVIFVMGLICFVPFVIFVRGVALKRDRP